MTQKLLLRFKQQIQGLELVPDRGGCFEFTVDGELVYSKLKTGKFPQDDDLVAEVARRLSK